MVHRAGPTESTRVAGQQKLTEAIAYRPGFRPDRLCVESGSLVLPTPSPFRVGVDDHPDRFVDRHRLHASSGAVHANQIGAIRA